MLIILANMPQNHASKTPTTSPASPQRRQVETRNTAPTITGKSGTTRMKTPWRRQKLIVFQKLLIGSRTWHMMASQLEKALFTQTDESPKWQNRLKTEIHGRGRIPEGGEKPFIKATSCQQPRKEKKAKQRSSCFQELRSNFHMPRR